jgi:hypothetical protein
MKKREESRQEILGNMWDEDMRNNVEQNKWRSRQIKEGSSILIEKGNAVLSSPSAWWGRRRCILGCKNRQ